jgi:hypothetical protein
MNAPSIAPGTEPATAQAGLSNRRDWKHFDARLAELRQHDVENITNPPTRWRPLNCLVAPASFPMYFPAHGDSFLQRSQGDLPR